MVEDTRYGIYDARRYATVDSSAINVTQQAINWDTKSVTTTTSASTVHHQVASPSVHPSTPSLDPVQLLQLAQLLQLPAAPVPEPPQPTLDQLLLLQTLQAAQSLPAEVLMALSQTQQQAPVVVQPVYTQPAVDNEVLQQLLLNAGHA